MNNSLFNTSKVSNGNVFTKTYRKLPKLNEKDHQY